MQARVEFAPVIYDTFAGRLGKYVGDYGRNFIKLEFPDKTVRAFPRQDVTFLDQSAATTSETDRIRRALASDELLVWGQIKRFEPYGKQYYLKKAYLGGFYGLNFVRLAGNLFPVGDVEIEIVERNEDFDYRQVQRYDLSRSFKEFRVLQYFQDWSDDDLIIDHVEWLYKTRVPVDQRQILVDRMLDQGITDETIWTHSLLNAEKLAEANLEPPNSAIQVFSADIYADIVADSAQNMDKYTQIYYDSRNALKRIFNDYLKARKKMPMSQKIMLSIEVFNQIIGGWGQQYLEDVRKKAYPNDYEMDIEEKKELFPALEDLVQRDRVRFMKNDPGRKLDIDSHPALDRLYDELISLYLSLLDQWEAARTDDNDIPDIEAGYDNDSFSYEYIIGLCRDIQIALLAFGALGNNPVDTAELRNQFKDAKGVQRHAQRAKGITRNPKERMEGTP